MSVDMGLFLPCSWRTASNLKIQERYPKRFAMWVSLKISENRVAQNVDSFRTSFSRFGWSFARGKRKHDGIPNF